MPSQDRVDDEPARETAFNPYLAPALRAAAAARARTARIRAQISRAQIGAAQSPAAPRLPPRAAAAPGARFARTMAEIERQLATPAAAAAPGSRRRPARLSGYAGGPRTSLWARLWSGLGRWMFE